MKTKSRYLESKGITINEFRNRIIYELKDRHIYGIRTRVYKYQLRLIGNNGYVLIPYRTLETKNTFKNIVDFYINDIMEIAN